jgi:hypothetical protein
MMTVPEGAVQFSGILQTEKDVASVLGKEDSTLEQLADVIGKVPQALIGSISIPNATASTLIDDTPLGLGAFRQVTYEGMETGETLGSYSHMVNRVYRKGVNAYKFVYRNATKIIGIICRGAAVAGITESTLKHSLSNNLFRNQIGPGNLAGFRALGYLIAGRDCTYMQVSASAKGGVFFVPSGMKDTNMVKTLVKTPVTQDIAQVEGGRGRAPVQAHTRRATLVVVSVQGNGNPDPVVGRMHALRQNIEAQAPNLTSPIAAFILRLVVYLLEDLSEVIPACPDSSFEDDGFPDGFGRALDDMRPLAGQYAADGPAAQSLKRRRVG